MNKNNEQGLAHIVLIGVAVLLLGLGVLAFNIASDSDDESSEQVESSEQDDAANGDDSDEASDEQSETLSSSSDDSQQGQSEAVPSSESIGSNETSQPAATLTATSVEGYSRTASGPGDDTTTSITLGFLVNGPSSGTCGVGLALEGAGGGLYLEAPVTAFSDPGFPNATGSCTIEFTSPDGFTDGTYNYTADFLENSQFSGSQYSDSITIPYDPFAGF